MFLLVVFVPLIPVILLTFYYQSYAKTNILETHLNLAKMVSSAMEQNIDAITPRLNFSKKLPAPVAKKNTEGVDIILSDALAENPDFIMLAVLDKNGKEIYKTGPKYITEIIGEVDLSQDEMLPYIRSSKTPNLSRFDIQLGLPLAELVYPLEDGNFLFGIVSFYRMWLRVEKQTIGTTGRLYLVDTSGNIFMSDRRTEQFVSPFYLNKAIESGAALQKNIKGLHANFVGAITPSPVEGAYVAVLQAKKEAYSALNSITAFMVFFIIVIAVLSYLAAVSFAGSIATPVSDLISGAKRVSKGDFDTPVYNDDAWKEFDTLIDSFNAMMADLKNYKDLQLKQQVSEMKEFVFKAVAHDLRAPILGLEGYVELLASGKFSKEEEQNYISVMKTALKDMLVSLENILDVSKFEAGILKTEKESFDAGEIIKNTVAQLKSLAEEKGLQIVTDIESAIPSYGDKTLVARVLSNIISNAIKFTETGAVTIKYSTAGGSSIFEIKDSGPGIRPQALAEIFDKYHQDNHTIKGYGLGLAISRQIVLAHNGTIKAGNVEDGTGAVFTFTLPLN